MVKFYRALLLGTALCCGAAHAAWPETPITLVVPFAAGGGTDTTARQLAEQLRDVLGQPVVVQNKPGAGTTIGAAYVARAKPDGYTFLLTSSTLIANITLNPNMPLDVRKDLVGVAPVAWLPNVLLVRADHPAKTLPDFVQYIQRNPGVVNYGSAGNGSSQHLSGALFDHHVKGSMVHVPYNGGAPANADLLSGQIQVVFSPMTEVLSFIDSGRVRPLGVTIKERSPRLPDVPAISEYLPDYEVAGWNGVFAPAGTPTAIIEKMNAAIGNVLQQPETIERFTSQGLTPLRSSATDYQQFVLKEIDKWGELVRLSKAQIE